MKELRLILLLLIGNFSFSSSQNLIDNWSFEDTINCPWYIGQITNSIGWETRGGTPDYFHICNTQTGISFSNTSVPQNCFDFQFPRSGNAYAGFISLITFNDAREFIGRQLTQPLQIGQKYFVKYFVSRAVNKNFNFWIDVPHNNLGALFFIQPSNGIGFDINNFSHIRCDSIITDTSGWTPVSGSFIPDSNYTHIAIGNFYSSQNTNYILNDSSNTRGYYFIDDICVSSDSVYCENLLNSIQNISNEIISVFPNPARDWIVFRGNKVNSVRIIDISGRILFSCSPVITPLKINVSDFANGIYIVLGETEIKSFSAKIFIYH